MLHRTTNPSIYNDQRSLSIGVVYFTFINWDYLCSNNQTDIRALNMIDIPSKGRIADHFGSEFLTLSLLNLLSLCLSAFIQFLGALSVSIWLDPSVSLSTGHPLYMLGLWANPAAKGLISWILRHLLFRAVKMKQEFYLSTSLLFFLELDSFYFTIWSIRLWMCLILLSLRLVRSESLLFLLRLLCDFMRQSSSFFSSSFLRLTSRLYFQVQKASISLTLRAVSSSQRLSKFLIEVCEMVLLRF